MIQIIFIENPQLENSVYATVKYYIVIKKLVNIIEIWYTTNKKRGQCSGSYKTRIDQ